MHKDKKDKKGGKEKKDKKDKKVKTKKEKKVKQKKVKEPKKDKKSIEKMSGKERQTWRTAKTEKKKQKKADLMEVDVYSKKNFAQYQEQVSESMKNAQSGAYGEAAVASVKAVESKLLGLGSTPGLQIWRIEKFLLVDWPKELHGSFYDGDSYIVLYTSQVGGNYNYNLHFWIGENSSQDEYGAAAVWTVRLDDMLQGKASQNREVQDYESSLFKSYFPSLHIMMGGVDSGFNHVDLTFHERFLKVKGKKNITVTQVAEVTTSMNSGDAFILDTEDKIFLWLGSHAGVFEKRKAGEVATAIRNQRGAKPTIYTIEEGVHDDEYPEFWEHLGGKGQILSAEEGGCDINSDNDTVEEKKLLRLSDKSGSIKMEVVATGKLLKSMLDSNDVFIVDSGFEVFVWTGVNASKEERSQALGYAQRYLTQSGRPSYLPITQVPEKAHIQTFETIFA